MNVLSIAEIFSIYILFLRLLLSSKLYLQLCNISIDQIIHNFEYYIMHKQVYHKIVKLVNRKYVSKLLYCHSGRRILTTCYSITILSGRVVAHVFYCV